RTALVVGGTTGDDRIQFIKGVRPGYVLVIINGKGQGVFRPTGRLIAYGQAGNDVIRVDARLGMATELYGGAGNDLLIGGRGPNLLVGGAGNDILIGNAGRDL